MESFVFNFPFNSMSQDGVWKAAPFFLFLFFFFSSFSSSSDFKFIYFITGHKPNLPAVATPEEITDAKMDAKWTNPTHISYAR